MTGDSSARQHAASNEADQLSEDATAIGSDEPLEFLTSVVRALAGLLGPRCEVVLHDLRHPDASVVAIANGEITDRKAGDPSSSLIVPILRDPYGDHDRFNYRSFSASGRPLKSSTVHFKDSDGRIFAAICTNWDLSWLMTARNVLQELTQTDEDIEETRFTDVTSLVDAVIDDALSEVADPGALSRGEKLRLVAMLRDRGLFAVRRAPEIIAARLGVSRATIYSYLSELDATSKLDRRRTRRSL